MKITCAREYVVRIDIPVGFAHRQSDEILSLIEAGEFVTAHVRYTPVLLDRLATFGFAPLVVVGDPRAVLSSFVRYVREEPSHILQEAFEGMSTEDAYLPALDGFTHESASLQPLSVRCAALNPWLESAAVLKVRFENLVGSRGDSSAAKQKESLVSLCEFPDAPADDVRPVARGLLARVPTCSAKIVA